MFVVGGVAAGQTTKRLTVDFSLPGQPGYETETQLLATFHNGGSNPPTIAVVTVPEGTTVERAAGQDHAGLRRDPGGAPRHPDGRLRRDPGRRLPHRRRAHDLRAGLPEPFESFTDVGPDVAMKPILEQASEDTGFDFGVTGYNLLAAGHRRPRGAEPARRDAARGLGALAVLLFLFASFLAFVPLLIAAVSILTTFTIVLLGTYVTDISFVVQFLIALVGLGVAVDYSLLVVNRWREERAHGRDNHDAVVVAMQYAGHAVVASAGTVAISLCALLVIPVPLLRSMGLGGMLIPLVSTAVILTLLPALLGRHRPAGRLAPDPARGQAVPRLDRVGPARRAVPLGRGRPSPLVILGALIIPIFGIKIGQAQTSSLASSGAGLRRAADPDGRRRPRAVSSRRWRCWSRATTRRRRRAGGRRPRRSTASRRPFAPDNPQWRTDGAAVVGVIPTDETVDSTKAHVVDDVQTRSTASPASWASPASGRRSSTTSTRSTRSSPTASALIALVTFVLLVRTFRSILLPVKAVLLNIVSVSATFGATVLFWQEGHGSDAVFGIAPTGAVTFWLPVLIFAFLFGLSMDYEVFILARMREEYDKTGDTDQAVIAGLGRTGRLVTVRRADPVPGVHRAVVLAGHRHQGVRDRPGHRHPARRHHRPRPAGPGAGVAVRPVELVAAVRGPRRRCGCSRTRRSRSRGAPIATWSAPTTRA